MESGRKRIRRSREGCFTCRRRKVKCDEGKPTCGNCLRHGSECQGYQQITFRDDTQTISQRCAKSEAKKWEVIRQEDEVYANRRMERGRDDRRQNSSPDRRDSTTGGYKRSSTMSSTSSLDPLESLDLSPELHSKDTASSSIPPTDSPIKRFSGPHPQLDDPDPRLGRPEIDFPASLPSFIREIWEKSSTCLFLRYAILSQPSFYMSRAEDNRGLASQSMRLAYYGMALKEFHKEYAQQQTDIYTILVALMSFQSIELELGTYVGGVAHLKHIDSIVSANIGTLESSDVGQKLLCHWIVLRSCCAGQLLPWESGSPFNSQPPPEVRSTFNRVMRMAGIPAQTIMPLLCESIRLHELIYLYHIVGSDISDPSYCSWKAAIESFGHRSPGTQLHNSSMDDLWSQLDDIRRQLDDWNESISPEDHPRLYITSDCDEMSSSPAIRFGSVSAAMTYAQYCASQLLCSRSSMDNCLNKKANDPETIHPWSKIIMQIIDGIDPQSPEVIDGSMWKIQWLVFSVLLPNCHNRDILIWIDKWIAKVSKAHKLEGDPWAFWWARRYLEKALQSYDNGRLILKTLTSIGPGDDIFKVMRQPRATRVLIYGRCFRTESFFHEVVEFV